LAIRAESREGQDLLTPPQEQDITTTTPFLKTIPQGVVLSFIQLLEQRHVV